MVFESVAIALDAFRLGAVDIGTFWGNVIVEQVQESPVLGFDTEAGARSVLKNRIQTIKEDIRADGFVLDIQIPEETIPPQSTFTQVANFLRQRTGLKWGFASSIADLEEAYAALLLIRRYQKNALSQPTGTHMRALLNAIWQRLYNINLAEHIPILEAELDRQEAFGTNTTSGTVLRQASANFDFIQTLLQQPVDAQALAGLGVLTLVAAGLILAVTVVVVAGLIEVYRIMKDNEFREARAATYYDMAINGDYEGLAAFSQAVKGLAPVPGIIPQIPEVGKVVGLSTLGIVVAAGAAFFIGRWLLRRNQDG